MVLISSTAHSAEDEGKIPKETRPCTREIGNERGWKLECTQEKGCLIKARSYEYATKNRGGCLTIGRITERLNDQLSEIASACKMPAPNKIEPTGLGYHNMHAGT